MIGQKTKWCFRNLFTEVLCALCVKGRKRLAARLLVSWRAPQLTYVDAGRGAPRMNEYLSR